jgi:hypothetical protein
VQRHNERTLSIHLFEARCQLLKNMGLRSISVLAGHIVPQIGFIAKLRPSSVHGLLTEGMGRVAYVSIQKKQPTCDASWDSKFVACVQYHL